MASSLLALLDDITAMTKVAAGKTAGVLGDDLALNAQQVTGVQPERELPVVWAVAKGSMKNKMILVPAALAISALASWAIIPLLMVGGAFLCYEGFEKVFHKLLQRLPGHAQEVIEEQEENKALAQALVDPSVDLVALENDKIKGAIRTDFILSAEIIVISLGTVATASFAHRLGVLVSISLLMTIGVYGLVAGIVKIDDLGLRLAKGRGAVAALGRGILIGAPWMMITLSVVGTAAMFLVGGGILVHGIPFIEHPIQAAAQQMGAMAWLLNSLAAGAVGVVCGGLVVGAVSLIKAIRNRSKKSPTEAMS